LRPEQVVEQRVGRGVEIDLAELVLDRDFDRGAGEGPASWRPVDRDGAGGIAVEERRDADRFN